MGLINVANELRTYYMNNESGIDKQQLHREYGLNSKYNDVVSIFEEGPRNLTKIVDMVIAARRHDNNREEIADALYESTKHALNYFKIEEEYMRKFEYKKIQSHIKEHKDFIKKTVEYCDETRGGNYDITDDYLDFLLQWVDYHIQGSDSKFVNTVRSLPL